MSWSPLIDVLCMYERSTNNKKKEYQKHQERQGHRQLNCFATGERIKILTRAATSFNVLQMMRQQSRIIYSDTEQCATYDHIYFVFARCARCVFSFFKRWRPLFAWHDRQFIIILWLWPLHYVNHSVGRRLHHHHAQEPSQIHAVSDHHLRMMFILSFNLVNIRANRGRTVTHEENRKKEFGIFHRRNIKVGCSVEFQANNNTELRE